MHPERVYGTSRIEVRRDDIPAILLLYCCRGARRLCSGRTVCLRRVVAFTGFCEGPFLTTCRSESDALRRGRWNDLGHFSRDSGDGVLFAARDRRSRGETREEEGGELNFQPIVPPMKLQILPCIVCGTFGRGPCGLN